MIWNCNNWTALLLLATVVSCLGCGTGSSVDRETLSGKVTFQGKPLPQGFIYFEPDISKGNSGPQGFAPILDGEYSTDGVGKGAVTGPLIIRISGFPRGGENQNPGPPLFPEYQTQIELKEGTTTLDFDVPSGRGM